MNKKCPRCNNSKHISYLALSEFNDKWFGCQDCYYQWSPDDHQGLSSHYRREDNPLEKRFSVAWETEQKSGNVLDYLLSPTNKLEDTTTTDRDMRVAATVIQWLGSPVGQCFLRDILNEKEEI